MTPSSLRQQIVRNILAAADGRDRAAHAVEGTDGARDLRATAAALRIAADIARAAEA